MNMTQIPFKSFVLALGLISIGAYGQKQTKTFEERFKVADGAVLDINTSHADIEFETWNNNEIFIQAIIELDGVSDEEAKDYFESDNLEILGNSKKVTITSEAENSWLFGHSVDVLDNFDFQFEYPVIPNMDSLDFAFAVIPEIADFPDLFEVPPMPPMPMAEFDYDAFKKDGKNYLEEWQKEFSKSFDKDYEKKLEEWSKCMAESRAKQEEKRALLMEKRQKDRADLLEKREKLDQKRAEMQERKRALLEQSREKEELARRRLKGIVIDRDSLRGSPNMFYFSNGAEKRKYKVKKTIKVKLPKSVKIKMNVRHGEVKLAENTRNLNAKLSYAALLASTIDGDATVITASYSPVSVQRWNYGQLQTSYSDKVDLKEVLNLRLSATSSDVVIDRLIKSAYIKNDLGPLRINKVGDDFKTLDVSLQNAEMDCELPSSSFTVYVNGISSKFTCPANLQLERTENLNSLVQKGYHKSKNTDRSITINSKFSDVVLKE
ncbi:hypothetical protein ACEZ3G_00480 [Maribacter algicola]|uniref:Uncharacterized protein n=1 Tax=Meishania litoralis TaxID=3434685 RepID=A0ACC7LEI6_9FLAO